jgi:hypothetical protein
MLVIPAAGPGDTQVPDMFVLDGVVSEGPQARVRAQTASMNFNGIQSKKCNSKLHCCPLPADR